MKVFSKVLLASGMVTVASSCNSFLDVNTNPNSATIVTPNQLLANALTVTAANYSTNPATAVGFNVYSSFASGYWTKSNVVSGYTIEQNYTYTTTYQQGLWSGTYRNLEDYELMRTNEQASSYPKHAAIARIMKAYNFLLLVDEYGDIPYTQALKGSGNTTPQFDSAESIYKSLVDELKSAVTDINANSSAANPGTEDVVFGGNMTNWKRFANSLRLRILLRMSSTSDGNRNTYVQTEMTALSTSALGTGGDGFITADVLVNPTYASNNNQQNPFYDTYGFAVGSSNPQSAYRQILPTNFWVNLMVNNSDSRITQEYRPVGATATSGGAYRGGNLGEAQPLSDRTGSTMQAAVAAATFGLGTFAGTFLRSPTQSTPLMLLADQSFARSEAELRGFLPGGDAAAKTDFLAGISASFATTFRNSPATPTYINGGIISATTNYNNYIAANVGNGLVDWDAATTRATGPYGAIITGTTRPVTKQEKIITQKWLANTVFASTEGWCDFRRTRFPAIPPSIRAERPGVFPNRLLYPQSEFNTNRANVPTVSQYDKIFWIP